MNINLSMNTWPIVIKDTMILLNLLLLFRHHVMSKSLPFHRLQHSRLPCPSPSPGVSSNSCPLCLWCHQIISSSGIQFSSGPASFPASGSFPVSQLLASALCIRWPKYWSSPSTSVIPMNMQGWFPLGLIGLISLLPQGLSGVFSTAY